MFARKIIMLAIYLVLCIWMKSKCDASAPFRKIIHLNYAVLRMVNKVPNHMENFGEAKLVEGFMKCAYEMLANVESRGFFLTNIVGVEQYGCHLLRNIAFVENGTTSTAAPIFKNDFVLAIYIIEKP